MPSLKECSSIGRAPVSKTGGWGFEPLHSCHLINGSSAFFGRGFLSKHCVTPSVIVVYGKQSLMTHDFHWVRGVVEGMRVHVRIFNKIQRIFYGLRTSCDFRHLQSGLVGAVTLLIIDAPLNKAVAQFPGVGSEAPSGVATTASDSVSSDADYAAAAVSEIDNSDIDGNASKSGDDVSSQSNYDGGSSGYQSPHSGSLALNLKNENHRKQLFIKKLRLEFAAIELVERKTGLPFSRGDVPRYLDELRTELNTMVTAAENGEITGGALESIARDSYYIKTHLNDYLDQLLEQAGQPVPRKPFFVIAPTLPEASLISGADIDALSLKFELAEYGEKALQAMGVGRY